MAVLTPEQQQAFAAQRLGVGTQRDLTKRRIQEDFDVQGRLMREQSDRDQYEVSNQMGSQGLYNSGIRINEQGQIVRRLNENIGQMDLARTRGFEDADLGYTSGLAGIAERERGALAEVARREAEQALQRELLEAQRQAIIRAAIPPPNPIINYPQPRMPQMPMAPPPPPQINYYQGVNPNSGVRNPNSRTPNIPFVNGAPIRTPMHPRMIQSY